MTGQKLTEHILFPNKRLDKTALKKAVAGKTILITGASYGIGEALVNQLTGLPVKLILVARTATKLHLLVKQLQEKGTEAYAFKTDLYSYTAVEELISQLESFHVNILIHNAGKSIQRSVQESVKRPDDYTRTMAVNYHSPVRLSLALLPGLIRNKGQIIYVSAVNVLFSSVPGWTAYQGSKSAMDQWGRAAYFELAEKGVTITAVYFPLVRTRMIAPTPYYRKMPAMEPSKAAVILCKVIIKRCRRWSPWWSPLPSFASRLFPVWWGKIAWYSFNRKDNGNVTSC